MMSWRQFECVIPLLKKNFHVIAVSTDGFDGTGKTTFTTSVESAEKLEDYIRNHLDGHVDLIFGESFGSATAGTLFHRQKAQADSLILSGPQYMDLGIFNGFVTKVISRNQYRMYSKIQDQKKLPWLLKLYTRSLWQGRSGSLSEENWMVIRIIIEGILLGALLVLFCAVGIRNGAVNMVFLYHQDVQDRCVKNGLITPEKIKQNRKLFKSLGVPLYFLFALVSAYAVNGARGFGPGFRQIFAILFIVNLIDRLVIDEYWVGHTNAWEIPGTEDMKPYINRKDKIGKWLMGTVGFAVLSAILSGIMALVLR